MSSSNSPRSSQVKPIPPAEARGRLSGVLTVIIRISWCVAAAFLIMLRCITQEWWNNSCHRVFAGKNQMFTIVTLCFSSVLPSFYLAGLLRICLDPVSGLEVMLNWVRLGACFCLVSSWSGVFSVIMWVYMVMANTVDCKNKAFYDFSAAAAIVTNLGVLVYYLVLGSSVLSG